MAATLWDMLLAGSRLLNCSRRGLLCRGCQKRSSPLLAEVGERTMLPAFADLPPSQPVRLLVWPLPLSGPSTASLGQLPTLASATASPLVRKPPSCFATTTRPRKAIPLQQLVNAKANCVFSRAATTRLTWSASRLRCISFRVLTCTQSIVCVSLCEP